ncbi:MAG: acetate kinase [Bacteroidetes bacterium]|nr:MAG: acetate kinase [Bacteroidota bacterium]
MKIMVLNCGSSSIKYQLFNMTDRSVMAKGVVEKIGLKGAFLMHEKSNGQKVKFEGDILDHQGGIEYILGVLISEKHGCISSLNEIEAAGHRVTHGGEKFTESVLINDEVKADIKRVSELAPLHNPHNLKGILAMDLLLPNIPQVAVFDTAFHQSMPAKAFMYATPNALYKKYGVRRYGFHGTSYRYVARKACEISGTNINEQKIVACHLGNGASITAINNGKSVDTSMGLTPVEGLIMGSRTGDLDLGALLFLMEKEEIGVETARTLINKHSGMLGITGVSSDMREIEKEAKEGNDRAQLGLDMYSYRIKKYIGAYAAAMGGIDMLIFTGGIGENADMVRKGITDGLSFLGIDLDENKNIGLRGEDAIISTDESRVKVMVVPTNEEYVIANDTLGIING